MPVIFDPNEAAHLEPAVSLNCTFLTGLEDKTGADFVLSTWDAPVTEGLLWSHVERGQGVQLKRGGDLVASVFDGRMINQAKKAREFWPDRPCILLHHCKVGTREKDGELFVTLDGRLSRRKFTYKAYDSTRRTWQQCGGVVRTVDSSYPLKQWVDDELERMGKDKDERVIRKPQVILTGLTPQEETLATFPGVGPVRAHDLWLSLKEHGARQTLLQAICWLTDGYAVEVKGFGGGIVWKAKEHLGVKDGERLWVEPSEGMKVAETDLIKIEVR